MGKNIQVVYMWKTQVKTFRKTCLKMVLRRILNTILKKKVMLMKKRSFSTIKLQLELLLLRSISPPGLENSLKFFKLRFTTLLAGVVREEQGKQVAEGLYKDLSRNENGTALPEAPHEDEGSLRGLDDDLHLSKEEDSKALGNGYDVPNIIWDPGLESLGMRLFPEAGYVGPAGMVMTLYLKGGEVGPAGLRKLLLLRAGMVMTLFPQDGVAGLAKEVTTLSLKAGNSEAEKKTKNYPMGGNAKDSLIIYSTVLAFIKKPEIEGEWVSGLWNLIYQNPCHSS